MRVKSKDPNNPVVDLSGDPETPCQFSLTRDEGPLPSFRLAMSFPHHTTKFKMNISCFINVCGRGGVYFGAGRIRQEVVWTQSETGIGNVARSEREQQRGDEVTRGGG